MERQWSLLKVTGLTPLLLTHFHLMDLHFPLFLLFLLTFATAVMLGAAASSVSITTDGYVAGLLPKIESVSSKYSQSLFPSLVLSCLPYIFLYSPLSFLSYLYTAGNSFHIQLHLALSHLRIYLLISSTVLKLALYIVISPNLN